MIESGNSTRGARHRRALVISATVIVLIVVILTGGALARSRSGASRGGAPLPDRAGGRVAGPAYDTSATTAAELVGKAWDAERSGDTTGALALLERARSLAPSDPAVATAIVRVRSRAAQRGEAPGAEETPDPPKPGDPAPEDPAGPPPAPRDDSAYSSARTDLLALLPPSTPGYSRGTPEPGSTDAQVALEPTPGSAAAGTVVLSVVAVHDLGTPAAARTFVERLPAAFPKSVAPVAVGALRGSFGTDGRRIASVAFARGRFAFEVVTTAVGQPEAAKAETVKIAASFPAARP